MTDLLFELGCEELPAQGLQPLAIALRDNVVAELQRANITVEGNTDYYATPRRLAVYCSAIADRQPDQAIEKRGPSKIAAFDATGAPTKALEGFLKSCNAQLTDLTEETTDKGIWLSYRSRVSGKPTQELLPQLITNAVKNLPLRKPMRWGHYDFEFLRPVQWLVLLFGKELIPLTLFNRQSQRETYGHRFMAPRPFTLKQASDYVEQLTEKGKVIPSFLKRRKVITVIAKRTADERHAKVVIDNDLLAEVTGLVEWPYAVLANFAADYLRVPREALIACMQGHQKVFPVVDANNHLLPHFIAISNISSKQPESVIAGNEKVMHARLADAAFFYDNDLKVSFKYWSGALAHVSFQKQLGNMAERVKRITQLSISIAKQLGLSTADVTLTQRAAELCKCDLMSQMVYEFPELQGIMGYHYAKHQGESSQVAEAIRDHYLPKFAGDTLPSSTISCAIALADKIDLLVGIFGINQAPTGDKDPFALRRATIGLIRLLIEKPLDLDIFDLLHEARDLYGSTLTVTTVAEDVMIFIYERLRAWYKEQDIHNETFTAVLAKKPSNLVDFHRRIQAVLVFLRLPQASNLTEANKRVRNILQKNPLSHERSEIDPTLLQETAEIQLASQLQEQQHKNQLLAVTHDYQGILSNLANLQAPVDQFFTDVMVMSDDLRLQKNRLLLLNQLREQFLQVADISLLS